jgi:hypothetical protein
MCVHVSAKCHVVASGRIFVEIVCSSNAARQRSAAALSGTPLPVSGHSYETLVYVMDKVD